MTLAVPRPTRIHLTCPNKALMADLLEAGRAVDYDLSMRPYRAQVFIFAGTHLDLNELEDWLDKTRETNMQRIAFIHGSLHRLGMSLRDATNFSFQSVASQDPRDYAARILGTFFLRDRLKPIHRDLIGQSKALRHCLSQLEKAAKHNNPVLLYGESGCGKELCAQLVHKLRRVGKLITVNCASLSPQLIESELFGHKKGAFTGAESDREGILTQIGEGTCFLDEIGELPLQAQANLLRVVENNEIRPVGANQPHPFRGRLVLATNRDLEQESERKTFRFDLYNRLLTLAITLPPLRARKEDIPVLIRFFLDRLNEEHGYAMSMPDLDDAFSYDWPGNVRELKNLVTRAYLLSEGKGLRLNLDLNTQLEKQALRREESTGHNHGDDDTVQIPYYLKKDNWEQLQDRAKKTMIKSLLDHENGAVDQVIAKSGLSKSQIYRLLKTLE